MIEFRLASYSENAVARTPCGADGRRGTSVWFLQHRDKPALPTRLGESREDPYAA